MTISSLILKEFFETEPDSFHRAVANAYLGKESIVKLSQELKEHIDSFSGDDVEEFRDYIYCIAYPNGETAELRKKILINSFWQKQKVIDLTGCKITVENDIKIFKKGENVIAVSFGNVRSGQFGEFNSPLISKETLDILIPGWKSVNEFVKLLKKLPLDSHLAVPTKKGYIEILPLSFFGVKIVPITEYEKESGNEIQVNNGNFSSETVANFHYENLLNDNNAFTPLFSKSVIADFDSKIFVSDSLVTLNRLQKTLRSIKRENEVLKKNTDSYVSWSVVNEDVLDSSIFSDKIGFFSTTTVGYSVSEPPKLDRDELYSLIVDALWTIEQALDKKIYLTDLNIGNVLFYDMSFIAEMCGWPLNIPTVREYSWGKEKVRVQNHYSRLVFVDLGTSFLERPSFGNKRVIDLSSPITKEGRFELQSECREDIISALMYCIIVNGADQEFIDIVSNLDIGKNTFLQFIKTSKENEPDPSWAVSEKYTSKVFQ